MENQVVCPSCKKTFPNSAVINDVVKGEGSYMQQIVCDCGERMTYWQVKTQLREQNTIVKRFQNWVRALLPSRG